MERPPHSDEYNSSLVALDIMTGRPKWKFRPSITTSGTTTCLLNPRWSICLTAKAEPSRVLQTTKRGQLFLLNRATGEPIADVVEKPVPTAGAVPEESFRLHSLIR